MLNTQNFPLLLIALALGISLCPVPLSYGSAGSVSAGTELEESNYTDQEQDDTRTTRSYTVKEILEALLSGTDAERTEQIRDEELSQDIEHRIGRELQRALEAFFDPNTFLTDVRADISKNIYSVDVPVLHRWEELRRADADLPGLPFVPEAYLRELQIEQEAEQIDKREIQFLDIERFEITLYADSLYSNEDLDLMSQIVESRVRLDNDRGDRFTIELQQFTKEDTEEVSFWAGAAGFVSGALSMLLLLIIIFLIWYFYRRLSDQREAENRNP